MPDKSELRVRAEALLAATPPNDEPPVDLEDWTVQVAALLRDMAIALERGLARFQPTSPTGLLDDIPKAQRWLHRSIRDGNWTAGEARAVLLAAAMMSRHGISPLAALRRGALSYTTRPRMGKEARDLEERWEAEG